MVKVGRFEAWIAKEDGTRFEEYKETTKGNTVECFVESVAGQHFTIPIRLYPKEQEGPDSFGALICVDGQPTSNLAIGQFGQDHLTIGHVRGAINSTSSISPYAFGATEFTGFSLSITMG
jgi:hypothetical protein